MDRVIDPRDLMRHLEALKSLARMCVEGDMIHQGTPEDEAVRLLIGDELV